MDQRYLPIIETAQFMGVSKWTLYRMVKERSIPYIPIRGKIVFDKEDIVEWMAKSKVPIAPPS